MKIDKNELRKIILEALDNAGQASNKEIFKQNAIKHLRMLKLLKATVNQVGTSPELKNMISQFQKTNTSDFLAQVLNVKPQITVKTSAIFENPMELVNDVIDEVIKEATMNARKKLQEEYQHNLEEEKDLILPENMIEEKKEGDLPFLGRDYVEKHKSHEKKKKGPPPPTINMKPVK